MWRRFYGLIGRRNVRSRKSVVEASPPSTAVGFIFAGGERVVFSGGERVVVST